MVILGRRARKEQLWHPDDAQLSERTVRLGFLDAHHNAHVLGAADEADLPADVGRSKSSRFVGVDHFNGRWRAQLAVAGRQIYLGLFDTEEEAAEAWRRAREAP